MADKTIHDLIEKAVMVAADEIAIYDSATGFDKKALLSAVSDFVLRIYDQATIYVDRANERVDIGNPSADNGPNTGLLLGKDLEVENDNSLWMNQTAMMVGGVLIRDPGNLGAFYTKLDTIWTELGLRTRTGASQLPVQDYDILQCYWLYQDSTFGFTNIGGWVYKRTDIGPYFAAQGLNPNGAGSVQERFIPQGSTNNAQGAMLVIPVKIKRYIDASNDISL